MRGGEKGCGMAKRDARWRSGNTRGASGERWVRYVSDKVREVQEVLFSTGNIIRVGYLPDELREWASGRRPCRVSKVGGAQGLGGARKLRWVRESCVGCRMRCWRGKWGARSKTEE